MNDRDEVKFGIVWPDQTQALLKAPPTPFTLKIVEDCEVELPITNFVSVLACSTRSGMGHTDRSLDGPEDLPEGIGVQTNLWLYRHSGDVLRHGEHNPFTCPWDSGQLGVAFVLQSEIDEHFNGDADAARECMEAEIDIYAAYIAGEWSGFEIWADEDETELVESCYGYIGSPKDNGLISTVEMDYHIMGEVPNWVGPGDKFKVVAK